MSGIDLDRPHVVDTPVGARFPIYTRANVAEIWPGPATPLAFTSQTGLYFDRAWRKALARFGAFDEDEFNPDHPELMGMFYGYPYLNLSVQRVFSVRMPGFNPDLLDEAFFGRRDDVPLYQPHPRDESPEHTARLARSIDQVLRTVEPPPALGVQRAEAEELRANRPDFASLSDLELFDYLRPIISTRYADINVEHMFVTSAASIPIGAIQAAAAAADRPELYLAVLGGLDNVDSAEPTFAMWELSRSVRASRTLSEAFDAGPSVVLESVEASDDVAVTAFGEGFRRLLLAHGYRGSDEANLTVPSWEMAPAVPLATIDRMRLRPDEESPLHGRDRLRAERDAAEMELLRLTAAGEERAALERAMTAARVSIRARERSKATSIMLLNEARPPLFELGRRMTARGRFASPEDFTLLTLDEYPGFLAAPADWEATIAERREWHDRLWELEPPFITEGLLASQHVAPPDHGDAAAHDDRRGHLRHRCLPWVGDGRRPRHPRTGGSRRAAARRDHGRAHHRSRLDADLHGCVGRRGRHRCTAEPRRDRQSGVRHPLRRLGDEREPAHPGRLGDRCRRHARNGDHRQSAVLTPGRAHGAATAGRALQEALRMRESR